MMIKAFMEHGQEIRQERKKMNYVVSKKYGLVVEAGFPISVPENVVMGEINYIANNMQNNMDIQFNQGAASELGLHGVKYPRQFRLRPIEDE